MAPSCRAVLSKPRCKDLGIFDDRGFQRIGGKAYRDFRPGLGFAGSAQQAAIRMADQCVATLQWGMRVLCMQPGGQGGEDLLLAFQLSWQGAGESVLQGDQSCGAGCHVGAAMAQA